MKASFDNLDDVNGKFAGTICMFDKKAVSVKGATTEGGVFFLNLCTSLNGRYKLVPLDHPGFSYRDFNVGYANSQKGYPAIWWYRRPLRQWKQGLKKDQMFFRLAGNQGRFMDANFGWNRACIDMLENQYPSIETCQKGLIDGEIPSAAFHKDFAISWDRLHDDFILEHRGRQVATSMRRSMKQFKVLPEFTYLQETIRENVTNVL